MAIFNRPTSIKGIGGRMPRLGKIRGGFKIVQAQSGKSYPAESPFFVLPPEVAKIFGFKDAETASRRAVEMGATRKDVLNFVAANFGRLAESLPVMFPVNDLNVVFPTAYKWWGAGKGLRCTGDGEKAMRLDLEKGGWFELSCPCEHLKTELNPDGDCNRQGCLMFMIPAVSVGGVYQYDMTSFNTMMDVQGGFQWTQNLIGRASLVILKLYKERTETHYQGKKAVHWTVRLTLEANAEKLNELRSDTLRVLTQPQLQLPEPVEINPAIDEETVIMTTAEEVEPKTEGLEDAPEPAKPLTAEEAFDAQEQKIPPKNEITYKEKLIALKAHSDTPGNVQRNITEYLKEDHSDGACKAFYDMTVVQIKTTAAKKGSK